MQKFCGIFLGYAEMQWDEFGLFIRVAKIDVHCLQVVSGDLRCDFFVVCG